MAVYTQRHQIADALGKASLEHLQAMIADCIAGEQARAAEDEAGEFSQAEFNAWLDEVVEQARRERYEAESDPLFFKAQAGEIDMAEWQAARQAVRDALPYLTEE